MVCVCSEINRTIVYTFCTISESQSGYLTETINYTLQTVGIICMYLYVWVHAFAVCI